MTMIIWVINQVFFLAQQFIDFTDARNPFPIGYQLTEFDGINIFVWFSVERIR